MKPSQLAQIIIRLFAISWFLHGVVQMAGIIVMRAPLPAPPLLLLSGGLAVVLSFPTWIFAPQLSRWISRGNDQEAISTSITFQQLLYAMFIGIGLYLALGSIGGLINSLHFLLVLKASPESGPNGMTLSVYDLSASAITVAVGSALLVSAAHWSKRLSSR